MAIKKENRSIRITLAPITQKVLERLQEITGDSKSNIIKESLNYYLTMLQDIERFVK